MSTLLPPDLHKMLDEEIRELADINPHAPNAKGTLTLNAQSIALLMLSSRKDTYHCDQFFKDWIEGDKDIQCPDMRSEFTRGMLDAARLDAFDFLDAYLHSMSNVPVEKMDITEAVSVELVVTIIGNLIMRDMQLAHDNDDDPEARR